MTLFRLTTARLLAQTWGNYAAPNQRGAAHQEALHLPQVDQILPQLIELRKSWWFSGTDPKSALNDAISQLNSRLVPYSLNLITSVDDGVYVPIYDENGTLIGHETIGFLMKTDGAPLKNEVPDANGDFDYGRMGCVFMGVAKIC